VGNDVSQMQGGSDEKMQAKRKKIMRYRKAKIRATVLEET
jgi:hypothetical protein